MDTRRAPPKTLQIGRFSILKSLGRGAQGAVYLARDPSLDRLVAIKLVSEIAGLHADVSAQARNLAQLRHPNIIALYELGQFHNFVFLVFEYLQGAPLHEELKAGGIRTLPAAYSLILQITDAVAYAHAKGILHLDLNPNNVMRDEHGKPRVMDFDLSRRADLQLQSAPIVGTLPYMAPEYFTSQRLDMRTDVYALGQMLFTFLSGTPAVACASEEEMIASICERDADFSLLERADPARHFIQVIRRATAKNPEERFSNARALHQALIDAWSKTPNSADAEDSVFHGTVAFAMKRIERRGDFPAVSRTLAEINQLTSDDSISPISQLTTAVLRDYALTNRLLKLASSSFYARPAGKVNSVSDAIKLLGIDQIRLICNGLACYGQFTKRKQDARLREESIASFIAGLLSRHLAGEVKIKETEQAFLAGMLFHLGKAVAMFYFPEDYEEIDELLTRGASADEAARSVLGVTLPELGYAVGESWGLPSIVLHCMLEKESAESLPGESRLRWIVRFANALVSADASEDLAGTCAAACASHLPPQLQMNPARTNLLLQTAVEKFRAFAPALEVDYAKSSCVQRLETWLAMNRDYLSRGADSDAESRALNPR